MKLPDLADRLVMRERPSQRPVGWQRWSDLLFLHWTLSVAQVQAMLPEGLTVDAYEGQAWVGIVPFFMERIRPACLPPLPWLSWFLELNVRTYVHDREGRPGVYFFSLDCNQPIAVAIARRCFYLNYLHARMQAVRRNRCVEYVSQRRGDSVESRYVWEAEGELREARPVTLEFFLLERYALFTRRPDGTLLCGRVHHVPYTFRAARVEAWSAQPALLDGLPLSGSPCSALASPGVDVSVYAIQTL